MAQLNLKLFGANRLLTICLLLTAIFLLAGGIQALPIYLDGGRATTFNDYRQASLAPLFGGSIMMGTYGLVYAYKNRGDPICLFGFLVTGISYVMIEYFFNALELNTFGGI